MWKVATTLDSATLELLCLWMQVTSLSPIFGNNAYLLGED